MKCHNANNIIIWANKRKERAMSIIKEFKEYFNGEDYDRCFSTLVAMVLNYVFSFIISFTSLILCPFNKVFKSSIFKLDLAEGILNFVKPLVFQFYIMLPIIYVLLEFLIIRPILRKHLMHKGITLPKVDYIYALNLISLTIGSIILITKLSA